MNASGHDPIPGSRFGLAGAAAMVAVCVTALALTAAGPVPSVEEAAGTPLPQVANCERCGRATGVADEPSPGDAVPEPGLTRCGGCGH